jgi:hypothetical protein
VSKECPSKHDHVVRQSDYDALAAELAALKKIVHELPCARCRHADEPTQSTPASQSETEDGYKPEAVERILAAKNAPRDPSAPTDPKEFLKWLQGFA